MERAWRVVYRRNGAISHATPHNAADVETARAHVAATVDGAEIITDRRVLVPIVRAVEAERNALYVVHVNLTRKVRDLKDRFAPDIPPMPVMAHPHHPDSRPDITEIPREDLDKYELPEDLADLQVELSDDRKALASQNIELRNEHTKLKAKFDPDMPGHHPHRN